MSTTGTYNYNITAAGMITEALKILGVAEEGVSATSSQITEALPAFEMYIKSLGKYGLELWTIQTESITMVASTYSYVPTNKFLKLTDVVYRDSSGEDTRMEPLARQEYWDLPNKDDTSSMPTQYYYDPQRTQALSTIYIWPAPDSTGAGSGETMEVTGQLLFQDIDTAGDGSSNIDVPQEWLETITYGLAVRLAPHFGLDMVQRSVLRKEYQQMLQESLSWDTEQESVKFAPSMHR